MHFLENKLNLKSRGMLIAPLVGLLVCLLAAPAGAQNVGAACTAGQVNHIARVGGPDYSSGGHFIVCDGANWRGLIEWQNGAGRSSRQIAKDTGACNNQKVGRMTYDEVANLWQYCDGANWKNFPAAPGGGCNVFGRTVGYVCPDGTLFAGFTVGSYLPIFTTRCGAGLVWDTGSSSCVGTQLEISGWGSTGVSRAGLGEDGRANTTTLVGFGAGAHPAAEYCANLTEHGRDDWYLPSVTEAYTLFIHRTVLAIDDGRAWTSNEFDAADGIAIDLRPGVEWVGSHQPFGKSENYLTMRCIRRD